MIETRDLHYQYTPERTISFANISVARGEHWLLLGESGSGKTTLLHLLGGLLRSQAGKVEINGTDITQLTESQLDHFRGQHLGFIFQRNHLISALSVENNLLMAPFLAGIKQDRNRVMELLEQLNLADKRHAHVKQLSQGQAQRVAIARAVLNRPSVILADEPTSALDDHNCDRVIHLLLDVAARNQATLLVATHDQRLKDKFSKQINL